MRVTAAEPSLFERTVGCADEPTVGCADGPTELPLPCLVGPSDVEADETSLAPQLNPSRWVAVLSTLRRGW